ncbi:MAG: ATP-binding protein [Myxococcaceae bacterium]|nr:ATP-binding protein [Myxococcaceae bacterium]
MSTEEFFHKTLEVESFKTIEPTPDILEAIKQDYKIEASVADLLDNSIDAGAKQMLIRFVKRGGRLVSLCIADDGRGMDDATIDEAMQFANRRKYTDGDLGMFGVGLKTASLSHALSVTVISTNGKSKAVGRRWSEAGIRSHAWRCDVISDDSAALELGLTWGFIGAIRRGTVVRWDDVRDFKTVRADDVAKYLEKVHREIRLHVGLKLHRFLSRGDMEVRVDELDADSGETSAAFTIDPINPFPRASAHKGYPKTFVVEIPQHGKLKLVGHIWPRKVSEIGYKLGTGKVAEHQGFYFYRHDRLIQAGGWNGFKSTTEPHLSLARVEIDIPDGMGAYLKVRSTKAGIDAPSSFADFVQNATAEDGTTLSEYAELAEQIYRTRGEHTERPLLMPGKGIPKPVQEALEKAGVEFKRGSGKDGMIIVWGRVTGKKFFELDRENDIVTLNDRYRKILNHNGRGGAADVPVVRTLLYFLLAPTLERERGGVAEDAKLNALQSALVAAANLERE